VDFLQNFVTSASSDIDELFSFGDKKVEGQGHSMKICEKYHFGVCFHDISDGH